MGKETSFWVGGLSSTAIYALLIFVIFFHIMNQPKKIAMISDGGMQITVDLPEPEPKPIEEPIVTPPPPTQATPEVKPDDIAEEEKIVKKPPVPKPPVEEKKERPLDTKQLMKQAIKQEPQPVKTEPKEKPLDAKSIVSSLDLKKNALTVSFNSSGEFDAYLNKIAQIIRAGWNPYSTDAGLVATISVSISGNGNFTFKLKSVSSNSDFDLRLTEYLKALQVKGLPPPDNNKNVSVDFNFKATQ